MKKNNYGFNNWIVYYSTVANVTSYAPYVFVVANSNDDAMMKGKNLVAEAYGTEKANEFFYDCFSR